MRIMQIEAAAEWEMETAALANALSALHAQAVAVTALALSHDQRFGVNQDITGICRKIENATYRALGHADEGVRLARIYHRKVRNDSTPYVPNVPT